MRPYTYYVFSKVDAIFQEHYVLSINLCEITQAIKRFCHIKYQDINLNDHFIYYFIVDQYLITFVIIISKLLNSELWILHFQIA